MNMGEYSFDHEPFYIGKGAGERDKDHIKDLFRKKKGRNTIKEGKLKHIIEEGMSPKITRVEENLSEDDAWELECHLIDLIGRICKKTGPLANIHKGGNGGAMPSWLIKRVFERRRAENGGTIPSNFRGKQHSEEARKKMRQAKLGKKQSPEHIQAAIEGRAGYQHSEETKKKMSESHKKLDHSHVAKSWEDPEIRKARKEKISKAMKGRKMMWVNNGERQGKYDEENALELIKQGWVRGRLPRSKESIERQKEAWRKKKESKSDN
jgi:hypothetical protein